MSVEFSDVERLVLARWADVTGLIDAHRTLQDRLEEEIQVVSDRVGRWARPQGCDVDCSPRDAEINVWHPSWADRKKEPRVYFTIGGFCPIGFRKVDAAHPYLWVSTRNLADYKIKEPERVTFAQALRGALGDAAKDWEAHDVDDAETPLGRYLTQYDNAQRARLLGDSDALFDFCVQHLPTVMALGDVVDSELQKIGK